MFYTYIPVGMWVNHSTDNLKQAARYFPLVGILVGSLGAAVFWLAAWFWPIPIAIALSMLTTILVTGSFHEDGLADCCDAFGGGWSPEQVLTIMKDSRLGTFGVVGLVSILGLKFLSLTYLSTTLIPFILIAGHSLSRFCALTIMRTHQYVRQNDQSKASLAVQSISLTELGIAGTLAFLPLILLNWVYWLLIIPLFLTRLIIGWYLIKRIGGYTGDALGGTQQITEVIFYLGCVAIV